MDDWQVLALTPDGLQGLFMVSNIKQLISLNGKNTLITGAFGGIGKEVMNLFLAHDQHVTE